MNFRKAKYLEFLLGLVFFVVGCFFYVREGKLNLVLLGVLLFIDFTVRLGFKIYTNKLVSKGIIVKVRQKEFNWWNTFNVVVTILTSILFLYFLLNREFLFHDKSVIIILLYIAVSSQLFLDRKGDFYIDKKGFIQPEVLKNNYTWAEIENFKLTNNSMSFVLNSKEYNVKITDEMKTKLIALTN